MSEVVLWRWNPVRRWMWAAALGALVAVGVVPAILDGGGLWPDALLYAAAWGVPIWTAVPALLLGMARYERITVTRGAMRVGRETIPIDRIDVDRSAAELTAPAAERAAVAQAPVGGAWAPRMGARTIVLRTP